MRLIDSHSHFDVEAFDRDREQALARARGAGVSDQIVPAIEFATWPTLREVCARHPGLHAAYGLHPMYLAAHRDEHLEALPAWIECERPVAVGEFGLDYFVEGLDRERQRHFFTRQLEIAKAAGLPVILHARRAVEDVLHALRTIGGLRGVVHSYAGSQEQARQLFDLGFLIGLGGPLTYERAKRLRRLVADMPLDHLLLETDSPDQPGCRHRGERNEPAHLTEVVRVVAELRGEPEAAIAAATTANAQRLFALPTG